MTMLITVFAIVLAIAHQAKKHKQVQVTITDTDVMHPAEFELRDHYFVRCSE